MINVMHSLGKPMNQVEKSLDPQLWHACAGGMAQIPPPNSKVYYFPQGHAEHANKNIDFDKFPKIPSLIPCRVSSIKYLADTASDEVFAKIHLVPLRENECNAGNDDDGGDNVFLGFHKNDEKEKTNSFAKTLTQSDANNGGGFSVPRYCAETIFPRLDYSAEPPVQTILAKDVHGQIWKFRHIYRGTPRRHLLTTGWSNFVNQKKLVAGDSIVFLRADNGDLCVGIRRAKRGISGGPEIVSGWNTNCGPSYFSGLLGEHENNNGSCEVGWTEKGNVRGEAVIEAARLAASGEAFEVVYYPRASTPEFVVRQCAVRAAMRVQWCSGMRFKMAFETEDSSRISWFMGTISSVHVNDPIHWPNSPWRLLQVAWDEPDLLQNVKRVNPWLVELVSTIPSNFFSPVSPPRKRARSEFPLGQLPIQMVLTNPLSPSSPLCCLNNNTCAGVQGARHTRFGLPDFRFNKLQMGLPSFDFKLLSYADPRLHEKPWENRDFNNPLSCLLKTGSSNKNNDVTMPVLFLFGQPILTAEQMSQSSYSMDSLSDGNQENTTNASNGSGSAIIQNFPTEPSSDGEFPKFKDWEIGQCKVFVESEDVGRTLDLLSLGSYEETYRKLGAMFGVERSEILSNIRYSDAQGTTKRIGDELFSDFVKKARRITIVTNSGSDDLRK